MTRAPWLPYLAFALAAATAAWLELPRDSAFVLGLVAFVATVAFISRRK